MSLSIIILAAGKGTRMKSPLPKVLHHVAHKPMLQHVIDTTLKLKPEQIIVVIGHGAEQVKSQISTPDIEYVIQQQQLGTGHAVQQCIDSIHKDNDILVLYGDVPLISENTLRSLLDDDSQPAINILSFIDNNPTGYGRIVRNNLQQVTGIVEEKDADNDIKKITECNSGIMSIGGQHVASLLNQLDNNNQQQEFYLTDVVKHAVTQDLNVKSTICPQADELLGVNNQIQLEQVESIRRAWLAEELMINGVKLYDAKRIDIRGSLTTGENVTIDINCIFTGNCQIGNNVNIGANSIITNATIGDNCNILANCIIEDSTLENNIVIGPFARLRPDTLLKNNVKVGNFVEIKKATIDEGSKVNHLSYIGDTTMGKRVNIGAGAITCNYDGAFKHQTIIEDDVFIGSDCQLIAPVTIAQGSTIGAGSTITKNSPENELTLSRSKQITIKGWNRPKKEQ